MNSTVLELHRIHLHLSQVTGHQRISRRSSLDKWNGLPCPMRFGCFEMHVFEKDSTPRNAIVVHCCLTRIVVPSVSPCHSISNPIQYFGFSNDLFSIMLHRSCLGCSGTTRCQPRMLATCLKADCKANGTAKRAPSKKKSHQKCDLKTGLRF